MAGVMIFRPESGLVYFNVDHVCEAIHNRVRDLNFSLSGLVGFDLHGKTAGIFGTGKIGRIAAQILRGFGMKLLAFDLFPSPE
jgi:lactate dehydrogenase-like 2-hydroxyacid dehydrogenase